MNVFGIGLPEILFILFLSLLIFGPRDLEKIGKIIGTTLNKMVRSENWRAIQQTTRELKNLPNRLMREAGIDEIKNTLDIKHSIKEPGSSTNDEKGKDL